MSRRTAADGKAFLHDASDQQHLVLLPKPPRARQHPDDDAAEFFAHCSNPETGLRELNIALPPGWMSISMDRLVGRKRAPSRVVDLARRAWSCWNGLSEGGEAFVVLVFDVASMDRLTVTEDDPPASPTTRGRRPAAGRSSNSEDRRVAHEPTPGAAV